MKSSAGLDEVLAGICDEYSFTSDGFVGKGVFKNVYKVIDSSGQPLALKIARGVQANERTQREIKAIQRCDHDNIAKLYDVGTYKHNKVDYHFMCEEFLSGGTLSDHLDRLSKLSTEEFVDLGVQLIRAIEHISNLNLVHRDIKPDNIMFREDNQTPVVVDFGLVRDLSAVSLTQSWVSRGPGTPYFASPEQLNNEKVIIDWRTDQFSLGVVLSYIKFGLHPYKANSESLFSHQTVERVASRGKRNSETLTKYDEHDLGCLDTMTKPWPVERFRFPHQLLEAWLN